MLAGERGQLFQHECQVALACEHQQFIFLGELIGQFFEDARSCFLVFQIVGAQLCAKQRSDEREVGGLDQVVLG